MEVDTIQALRALVRGRREDLGLSQGVVAARAGVSRKWLSDFEAGKQTVELGKVFALLEALGVVLHATISASGAAEFEPTDEVDLDAILDDYRAGQW